MDGASLIGLSLGIAAVLLGTILEGGNLGFIFQPAAAAIVCSGNCLRGDLRCHTP
jgi:chemotaxis protein MotA